MSRAADARGHRGAGLSVRTRITLAVALLTSLALAGAGLVVYALESARIDRGVAESVDREIAEFRSFQANAVDPATGQRYRDAEELVVAFLSANLAEDDELLVGWFPDAAEKVQGDRHRAILRDPAFERAVADRLESGGSTTLDTRWGEVSLTVQPVTDASGRAAFLDVVFLSDKRAELQQTLTTYLLVGALSLGLITVVAAWQAGRLLQPLRTLSDEAQATTESDLSRRIPERGNDDITALTRTYNEMLDRLEAAFAAQRTFLDDAGHELRTPLTVVRGHVELLDPRDPDDVAETRALLLDETDRMSRLVEDLIMLAKADRPDFVRPTPTDVAALTATVLDKSRALGDRGWTLDGAAEVEADVDAQRLTQALLQLAENAVKHTRPGDEVALGSEVAGDVLRLWVRDTGPGVADDLKERVFARFDRGGVHDDQGAGLGLSIVTAIASAHGGQAHVEDAVPSGARFVITLPWHRTNERED